MVDFKSLLSGCSIKNRKLNWGKKNSTQFKFGKIQLKCPLPPVSHPNAQLNTVLKFEFTGQQVK